MLRSCEILTDRVVEAALRSRLPAEERAALLRHLREPCAACLDRLEGWTTEEMLSILHSPDDLLSRGEQERAFAAAVPGIQHTGPALRLAPAPRRRIPRLLWVPAAAVVVLVGVLVFPQNGRRPSEVTLKGAPTPSVALIPLAGARTPTPHVVRALPPQGRLAPGEVLLLRVRLGTPAWVYLLSQKQGEPTEVLWPEHATTRHEAGEFELAESGSALAIDPKALGAEARVLVVASPGPIDRGRLKVQEPVRTPAQLQKLFPDCGVDVLPIAFETE